MPSSSLTYVIQYIAQNGEFHTSRLRIDSTDASTFGLVRTRSAMLRHLGPALQDTGHQIISVSEVEESLHEVNIDLSARQLEVAVVAEGVILRHRMMEDVDAVAREAPMVTVVRHGAGFHCANDQVF